MTVGMAPAAGGSALDGRYELTALIARGGMGEVWAATDHRLGREVAVKLLRTDLAVDRRARQRFQEEARAAALVTHPNIVAVYDTGEHEGTPYIVMERLSGRTLADDIATGPLHESRARLVTEQVLNALAAAHAAGVVHRDVKPSNILVTDDGTAKVADFGIAKAAESSDLTTTGLVVGTRAYVAPERLHGGPATPATDLYSVGVMWHEMLTGQKPDGATIPLPAVSTELAPVEPEAASRPTRSISPAVALALLAAAVVAIVVLGRGTSGPGMSPTTVRTNPVASVPSLSASTTVTTSPPPVPAGHPKHGKHGGD
jgi:serine/threonine-protein kinase